MHYRCLFFLLLSSCFLATLSTAQKQRYRILYSDVIFFKSGADQITPRYRKVLTAAAAALRAQPDTEAWIQAHTDSLGSYESNLALSDRRAQSVLQALRRLGIDTSQLRINSLGEYIPFRSNGTSDGRAYNRRVSIDVVEPFEEPFSERNRIVGRIVDAKTQEPLYNTRVVFNSLTGRDTVYTDPQGKYHYYFYQRTNIEVRACAKGYFFVSKVAKFTQDSTKTQDSISFSLERAVLGKKMALSDLYFKRGTALLLPASQKALQGLWAFMAYNEHLSIEIGGHINKPNAPPVLEKSSSFQLSKDRAQVVYDYLIDKGIEPTRLTYKGYGNSEMIHPRADNPIQEQMNRRVELTIIGE